MKKLSGILVVLALLIVCAVLLPTRAQAASESDLTFTFDGKSYSVSDCNSSASGELVIPATYNGKPVTSIGSSAFRDCTSLTSITIPDSVTSIGSSAFYDCDSLTSVTIPDGVTIIYWDAFEGCTGLTSITIPDGVTSIYWDAFRGCTSLTSITIPDSVTSIGNSVFYGCTGLTSITIPDSVTSIDYSAFEGCIGLTSITIPDSVTSIGERAFYRCSSLTNITIGNGVTTIGKSAFSSCSKLKDVYITDPGAWCKITFYGSSSNPMDYADELHILDADGNEVTELVLDNTVTYLPGSSFKNCVDLTSVTIPDSVTGIGEGAFSGCSKLESITIPFVGGSKKSASNFNQYPFGYIFGTSSYTGGVATKQYFYYGDNLTSLSYFT